MSMKPGPNKQDPAAAWLKGHGPRPDDMGAPFVLGNDDSKPIRVPRAPAYLGKHGRKVWRDLYRELAAADLIAVGDLPAFELLCSSFEQCRLANESLAEHGPLIPGTRGTLVRNPAAITLREASALFLKLADRFGLTPAAADRLGLGVIDD